MLQGYEPDNQVFILFSITFLSSLGRTFLVIMFEILSLDSNLKSKYQANNQHNSSLSNYYFAGNDVATGDGRPRLVGGGGGVHHHHRAGSRGRSHKVLQHGGRSKPSGTVAKCERSSIKSSKTEY